MLHRWTRSLPLVRSSALLVALLVGIAPRAAAVSVSPTALFIDARNPTTTMTLFNGGSLPEEIEISFAFGYPRTAPDGTLHTVLTETAGAGEPSVVPWLRVFPRRMVLQPGQRQTVRVLVSAPADIPDGEYWGRVVVHSRGGQPPIEQSAGDVRVQLAIETAMATAVLFRKGPVETGVQVRSSRARVTPQGVAVDLDVERAGNAVFLGHLTAELVGADRRVIAGTADDVAIYRNLSLRYVIPLPAGAPTSGLTVRYTFETERPELPEQGLLKAAPVTATIPVQ